MVFESCLSSGRSHLRSVADNRRLSAAASEAAAKLAANSLVNDISRLLPAQVPRRIRADPWPSTEASARIYFGVIIVSQLDSESGAKQHLASTGTCRAQRALSPQSSARDRVRYKLAILNVLANQPDGRATRDAVRREAGLVIASLDQTELQRFTALGDIDIFQAGLVLRDDTGLQITDAGLALLNRLQAADGSSLELSSSAASPAVGMIDTFTASEKPSRPSAPEGQIRLNVYPPSVIEGHRMAASAANRKARSRTDPRQDGRLAVVQRAKKIVRSSGAFIATKGRSILVSAQAARKNARSSEPRKQPSIGTIAGAAFGIVALLLVVACVLAAIAFGQIQSLKSDIALLRRELLPVKERFAKLEEAENERRDEEQQQEAQKRFKIGKDRTAAEARSDRIPLSLTREEIQLVREYIKPAPSAASAEPVINVGDAVGGAMIPLPSALTDKVPKLAGARFTTRNGAIVLVKKDSRQADAVLGPH
jgi:hypothetical protein